jgi:hypothetical protein
MRLRKILLPATLILGVIAGLRGNVSAYDMAEYYPINQGDEWIYSATVNKIPTLMKWSINGTEVVNEVNTIKVQASSPLSKEGDYICIVMDSSGCNIFKELRASSGVMFIYDETPLLFFPAQFEIVGESHQQFFSYGIYSTDDGSFMATADKNSTVSLESVENVTVTGKTFENCLKITNSGSFQVSENWYGEFDYAYWYAKNVGLIKYSMTDKLHLPRPGDMTLTMTGKLIGANVDGEQYGCPMTFALGDDSKDINILRRFRDEVLSKTPAGREIIKLYYQWSPAIVKAMEQDEGFKEEVKEMIEIILPMVKRAVE